MTLFLTSLLSIRSPTPWLLSSFISICWTPFGWRLWTKDHLFLTSWTNSCPPWCILSVRHLFPSSHQAQSVIMQRFACIFDYCLLLENNESHRHACLVVSISSSPSCNSCLSPRRLTAHTHEQMEMVGHAVLNYWKPGLATSKLVFTKNVKQEIPYLKRWHSGSWKTKGGPE